jgi:hypothetical protein
MKYVLAALLAVVAVALVAAPATADWDPVVDENGEIINHKMHWPQLPDLLTGLNVRATSRFPTLPLDPGEILGKVLADDFLCTQTGPITDIHIWGSWLNDLLPWWDVEDEGGTTVFAEDPGAVAFRLSLHGNVEDPDDTDPNTFSHPDDEFWNEWFFPGEFEWREVANAIEGFMDPNIPVSQVQIIGFDTRVFQYNFFPKLPPNQVAGEIYWLDVTAVPLAPGPEGEEVLFGWKSARPEDRWMDDAVYGHMTVAADGSIVPVNDWLPLKYPLWVGHPYEGQTMDLSFVITPEPGTLMMLLGAGLIGLTACGRRRRKN